MSDPSLWGVLPGTTGNLDPGSANKPAGAAGWSLGTGTGQHGVIPVVTGVTSGVKGVVNDFTTWINKPFTTPMTPGSLTMIVGTIFVAVVLWNFVLYHVRIAAEAI